MTISDPCIHRTYPCCRRGYYLLSHLANAHPPRNPETMPFTTFFKKPHDYRLLTESEEKPTRHRASSPDGSLSPNNGSEHDLFLSSSTGARSQRVSLLRRHWHLTVESVLLFCNICIISFVLLHLGAAPLGERQKECGRVLGQWRRFAQLFLLHSTSFLSRARLQGCPKTAKGGKVMQDSLQYFSRISIPSIHDYSFHGRGDAEQTY